MQIAYFTQGGFVAHKYNVPGSDCRFSVWFNRDGYAIEAERIDAIGRAYPATRSQWAYIERHKLAGLASESEIRAAALKQGVVQC